MSRMALSPDVDIKYPLLVTPLQKKASSIRVVTQQEAKAQRSLRVNRKEAETEASTLQFWGNMIYNKTWTSSSSSTYGIYSFSSNDGVASYAPLATNLNLQANGGGVFFNGIYHYVRYISYGGEYYVYYGEYDVANKKFIVNPTRVNGMSLISACGIAYDKASGHGYGQFLTANGQGLEFGELDFDKRTRNTIATGGTRLYAIAMSEEGRLYAIDENGQLVTIDKKTGSRTIIGSTGVIPHGMQSAAFNPADGNLYWASIDSNESSVLYKVNTADASLKKVAVFSNSEEILGLYFPSAAAKDDAPASVDSVSAIAESSTPNNINVSFTLPTRTFKGDEMSGSLSYSIYLNGDVVYNGTGTPGQVVRYAMTTPTGEAVISVVVKNAAGESPFTLTKLYAGPDAPAAPSNVILKIDSVTHKAQLTWKAPSEFGINKGVVDLKGIQYKITRYPESKVVGTVSSDTVFTETLSPEELTLYHYSVVAVNKGVESQEGMSNYVALGDAKNTPYTESFDDKNDLSLFTIINSNKDNYTWEWKNNAVGLHYNWKMDDDDWLITPGIRLKAGRRYTFSLKATGSFRYNEKLEVKFGKGADPAGYENLIDTTVIKTSDGMTLSHNVEVAEDGSYRFGIHGVSPKDNAYMVYVDDIKVDEGILLTAPDSVKSISISPKEPGSLMADIRFTVPDVDLKGNKITAIDSIVVYRENGDVAGVVHNPVPGHETLVTDNRASNGFNTYSIVAYNVSGKGVANSARAFLGIDTPEAVSNVRLVDNGDGTASMSWNAVPDRGINGGYVDTGKVVYDIYKIDGNEATAAVTSVTGQTSVELTGLGLDEGEQDALVLAIVATTSNGTSSAVPVSITIGKSVSLPFTESFTQGSVERMEWFLSSPDNNNFALYTIPEDNDGGSIRWLPTAVGQQATLSTGKLNISASNNPKLSFWYYAAPGKDIKLQVEVDKAQKNGQEVAQTIDFNSLDGEEGWRQAIIDLNSYKNEKYVIVRFHGLTNVARVPLVLDNIRITDVKDHDLSVGISPSGRSKVGQSSAVNVTVTNFGQNTASDYVVNLYANGEKVDSASDKESELMPYGGYKSYTLHYKAKATDSKKTALRAEIVYGPDED